MQDMRYINLFGKVTGINTRFCFKYNEIIFFCVPRHLMSKAIGDGAKNIRKMHEILGKKIKVIPNPESAQEARFFIESIINPFTIKNLEVKENEIILTAGQSKAALIGREKRRLLEMQKIVKDIFDKDFRII